MHVCNGGKEMSIVKESVHSNSKNVVNMKLYVWKRHTDVLRMRKNVKGIKMVNVR